MQRENRLSLDVFLSAGYFLVLFRQIGGIMFKCQNAGARHPSGVYARPRSIYRTAKDRRWAKGS